MYKLFIDDIRHKSKKMLDAPSPDTYTLDSTFGKKGLKYSMSGKLNRSGLKVDDRH
jgi:hypothetical protein